jgi:hypothetical protein
MITLEDRPQRSVFATLGPMYRSNDDKAWKAARKAGLIAHKVPGIGIGPDFDSVFVVCVEDENGKLSNFRKLFTAEEVIAEARKPKHETFYMGDIFEGYWQAINAEPQAITIDVPCVSSGL